MPTNKKPKRSKKTVSPVADPADRTPDGDAHGWRKIIPLSLMAGHRSGSKKHAYPHRSFRRTYRRDYVQTLQLPGYIAFTIEVWRKLLSHKKTLGALVLVYALASGIFIGFTSQSMYAEIADSIRSTTAEVVSGNLSELGNAGTLLSIGLSGGTNAPLSEGQQIISSLMMVLVWMATVWLLRAYFAGQNPGLRDSLYNSGAPLVPTLLIGLTILLQLVPVALAVIGLSAALPSGLIDGGVEGMLFWMLVFLLTLLTLYWITSTIIALVIVTLPGMYPVKALRTANELVLGRRLPVLMRILWLIGISFVNFVVIMTPVILLDAWLKGVISFIDWLPIVPIAFAVMSASTVVWGAIYIYLLYRRIIDAAGE